MTKSRKHATVAIALCSELEERCGLDHGAVRAGLREAVPDVRVGIVTTLCDYPDRMQEIVGRMDVDRLVFGLCEGRFVPHEFQANVRKAGIDPYAVELIGFSARSGRASDPELEEVLLRLRAAVARVRAFVGSEPEQLRPRLLSEEGKVSRRSLFTLPPLTYEAVPSIDRDSCLGLTKCSLCVGTCPVHAIGTQDGDLVVDKTSCVACGICVTTCPVGAVHFPGSSLSQYEAELAVLLSQQDRSLLFACRSAVGLLDEAGGREESGSRWLPIGVPCVGMVTAGWILQALAGGAPAVALLSCGERCRSGRQPVVAGRVGYARTVLAALGDDTPGERVRLLSVDSEKLEQGVNGRPPPGGVRTRTAERRVTLTEPAATVEAVLELAGRYGASSNLSLAYHASPLGRVRHKEETCTLCGTCVGACPTGALTIEGRDGTATLSYDAAHCIGCGRCASSCPEAAYGTLLVEGATDLAALARGPAVLMQGTSARCRRCGRPIAPAAMLDRVQEMLREEGEADALPKTLRELCANCRGLAG